MDGSELHRAARALGVKEDATRRAVLRALAERRPVGARRWRFVLAAAVFVLGSVAFAAARWSAPELEPAAQHVARKSSVAAVTPPEPPVVEAPAPKPQRRAPAQQPTWRHARALRAEGRTREALTELAALEAAGDPVWAPLAQLETARLLATVSGEEPRALEAVRRFLAQHPNHELVVEARALEAQLEGR